MLSSNARIRIDSVGNIFFALSPQIAVRDTLNPTLTCPPPVVAECTGNNGVAKTDPQLAAFFAGASATDACDASVPITNNAPNLIPLGNNNITFTGTDDSSNAGVCSALVSVVDTTLPTISVSVAPTGMFPPNHKMFDVIATVVVNDSCDPNPQVTLTSITSNEPANGNGDGNTEPDVQGATFGTADFAFQLRAERTGSGSGAAVSKAVAFERVSLGALGVQPGMMEPVPQEERSHERQQDAHWSQVNHKVEKRLGKRECRAQVDSTTAGAQM